MQEYERFQEEFNISEQSSKFIANKLVILSETFTVYFHFWARTQDSRLTEWVIDKEADSPPNNKKWKEDVVWIQMTEKCLSLLINKYRDEVFQQQFSS